jgi:hypothetical protein
MELIESYALRFGQLARLLEQRSLEPQGKIAFSHHICLKRDLPINQHYLRAVSLRSVSGRARTGAAARQHPVAPAPGHDDGNRSP